MTTQDIPEGLPFRFKDYLELVDWTGRIVREDKSGSIPADNTLPSCYACKSNPSHGYN